MVLEKTLESPLDCKDQSTLKEISPEYSLEKILMLGKVESRRSGWQRIRWLDGITDMMDMSLNKLWEIVKDRKAWQFTVQRVGHDLGLKNTNNNTL